MAQNYDVNYDDERFTQVEADKNAALTDIEKTYGGMIGESGKFYQEQIDATKQWADKQSQLQQEQTDFTIEQIEQQKAQAQKDYTKEQSGAYVDWRKQSNQYGTEAEKMASQGLTNTGFSESSQVSMYNTYQNRVSTARESYNQAVLNYNNAIKDARLQNNAALAEIAYQALQQQLELSLQGFQYKNNLILEQTNKKLEVDQMYYSRYQDVLEQINHENALAEQVRQFNENYALQVKEYEEGIRQFNEEIARLKKKDEEENAMAIKELELKKKQLEEEQRQFNETLAYNKAKSSGGGVRSYIPTNDDTDTGDDVTPSALDTRSVNDLGLGPITDDYVAELAALGGVTVSNDGKVSKTSNFELAKAIANTSSQTQNVLPTNYLLLGNTTSVSGKGATTATKKVGTVATKTGTTTFKRLYD